MKLLYQILCALIAASLFFLFVLNHILTESHKRRNYNISQSPHVHSVKAVGAQFSNVPGMLKRSKNADLISTVFNNGWSYCPVNCLKMHASLIAKTSHLKGINIECGVADGGTAMIAAAVKPKSRELHLYDTFAGIPKPLESELGDIQESYREVKLGLSHSPNNKLGGGAIKDGYNNTLQDVLKTRFFGLGMDVESNNIYFHPGLFQNTLNETMASQVAFAHLDGDWYDSTMTALTYIMPRLLKGGFVVVDDYFSHSGCRRAVDEYFGFLHQASRSKDFLNAPVQKSVDKFGKKWMIHQREYKLVLHVL